MKDVMHAVIFGFKEILSWNTMRFALVSGFLVTVLWGVIGFVLWDQIVAVGAKLLSFVPFSMIRSNGALLLSSFVWVGLVLLTFSLIFAFFGNLILRSVSKEKYTAFSFIIIVLSAIFWSIIFYIKSDYIHSQLLQLLTWLPFETISKGIGYLIGYYVIYSAIVASMVFIVSLFSEPLIKGVAKRHFKGEEIIKNNEFKSMGYTIKDIVIYFVISLVAFPLLFVPIVNFIVLIILWIWLVKDTFRYDAASLLFKDVDTIRLKEHKTGVFTISFLTALFNFVPVFNIFGPFFGEISMFHYLRSKKLKGEHHA